MGSYEHTQLVQRLKKLDDQPRESDQYREWLHASDHLGFVAGNLPPQEIVVYGCGQFSYVHGTIVTEAELATFDEDRLYNWGGGPDLCVASYVWGGGRDDVWIERLKGPDHSDSDGDGGHLLFDRSFEGWEGKGRRYIELSQEYAHLTESRWRPEHSAYCRFDANGDIEHVASITLASGVSEDVTCVSFLWEPLEEYLAANNAVLIRRFDFTLFSPGKFEMWSDRPEERVPNEQGLRYRQKVDDSASYTMGVQIIRTTTDRKRVFSRIKREVTDDRYVDLVIHDWRNHKVRTVSTRPDSTTSYFDANKNQLPFEVSPAYFRPEVILKYKADRQKYTVTDRSVACRASWHLKSYGTNEAGQVFAYVCDLRRLPYAELLHWMSFNEPPRAGLPDDVIQRDFEGVFADSEDPVPELRRHLEEWRNEDVFWWTLRSERDLEQLSQPISDSRDEWADAIHGLDRLIVEGLSVSNLRKFLSAYNCKFDKDDKSIRLLERAIAHCENSDAVDRLEGLRSIHTIRSKVKGHATGTDAEKLVTDAIANHGSFAGHFGDLCRTVVTEIDRINTCLCGAT